MRPYGRDYARDAAPRRGNGRGSRRGRSAPWLAAPIEGRVGYDRVYGEFRGARYGDRYDQGYAPISETNPLARQLRREYPGFAPGSWRRACGPRYDRDF